jgi:hypothetical protein
MDSFLTNENVNVLWEVILDEVNTNGGVTVEQLQPIFNRQIRQFYEREKTDNSANDLFQLNSQFISTFINTVANGQISPNPVSSNPVKRLITVEDLHADRLNSFDTELASKRREFDSAMTRPIPETPQFKDTVNNNEDKPISEMDKLIAATLAERNYEIEQIYKNNNTSDSNWLQPKETSIKAEKGINQNENINTVLTHSQPKLKYIKIGDNVDDTIHTNTIILPTTPNASKKTISWADNNSSNIKLNIEESLDNEVDIFSKLKTLKPPQLQVQQSPQFEQLNNKMDNLQQQMDKLHQQMNIIIEKLTNK